jgi:hypothetical protein
MKRLIALTLMMGMGFTNAPAMDRVGMEMTYTGGTMPGVRPGVDGTLETTSPTSNSTPAGEEIFPFRTPELLPPIMRRRTGFALERLRQSALAF